MSDTEYVSLLESLLLRQQEYLWSDLSSNLHNARNGYWSISCEGTIERIWEIAQVVGFTSPGSIQIGLLSSGVYYAVLDNVGKQYERLDPTGYEEHFHTNPDWATKTIEEIKKMRLEPR